MYNLSNTRQVKKATTFSHWFEARQFFFFEIVVTVHLLTRIYQTTGVQQSLLLSVRSPGFEVRTCQIFFFNFATSPMYTPSPKSIRTAQKPPPTRHADHYPFCPHHQKGDKITRMNLHKKMHLLVIPIPLTLNRESDISVNNMFFIFSFVHLIHI